MKKIGVIGYGNIGEAMISGMLKSGFVTSENVLVSSRNEKKIKHAIDVLNIGVTRDNMEVVAFADILIIAVKPIGMAEVLDQIKDHLKDQVLVSVVSSVEIADIVAMTDYKKVVRSMLNTPVMVNEGMSALSMAEDVTFEEEAIIVEMFKSFGEAEIVDEKYMDIITAVSGTSPAYVFMLIEAMADGGVLMGLPRRKAYRMSAQAVLGAAKMVLESDQHPGSLKDMVTSPGGSTIDGIYTLETNNFRGTIMKTIKDATRKVIRIRERL